jgi:hypothetical protein
VFGAKLAAASAILGAIIGFVFRKHLFGQVTVSIVVSTAFFAVLEWHWGDSGEWSWRDPITSAAYLVAQRLSLFVRLRYSQRFLSADCACGAKSSGQSMNPTGGHCAASAKENYEG